MKKLSPRQRDLLDDLRKIDSADGLLRIPYDKPQLARLNALADAGLIEIVKFRAAMKEATIRLLEAGGAFPVLDGKAV